jgi:hypothetical protein
MGSAQATHQNKCDTKTGSASYRLNRRKFVVQVKHKGLRHFVKHTLVSVIC